MNEKIPNAIRFITDLGLIGGFMIVLIYIADIFGLAEKIYGALGINL